MPCQCLDVKQEGQGWSASHERAIGSRSLEPGVSISSPPLSLGSDRLNHHNKVHTMLPPSSPPTDSPQDHGTIHFSHLHITCKAPTNQTPFRGPSPAPDPGHTTTSPFRSSKQQPTPTWLFAPSLTERSEPKVARGQHHQFPNPSTEHRPVSLFPRPLSAHTRRPQRPNAEISRSNRTLAP